MSTIQNSSEATAVSTAGASGHMISAPAVSEWTARYSRSLLDVFGPPQTVLVRGEGCYVWDADGKRYLDLLAGIAVNALGHAHPTLTGAVSAQLATLGHVSNFFATPTQVALAERLLQIADASQGSRVFFANSGTEANEAAFKLARRNNDSGVRTRILALEGSFHGRTMGALALTSKAAYREPFEPLPAGVEFIPAGDLEALEAAFAGDTGDTVAALFIEPIQGEGGVLPLPPEYFVRARELTAAHGALLIVDEVQTGMGRTGSWLAYHQPAIGGGITPDVVTLAKGLGGGIPIGALVAYGPQVAGLLNRGQHGTTFGGNPVAAAAALATISVIERDQLLSNVSVIGEHLRLQITALAASGSSVIRSVRGAGLLIGIELADAVAPEVVRVAREAGFIINAVTPSVLRICPPLLISREQVDTFVEFLAGLSLTTLQKGATL